LGESDGVSLYYCPRVFFFFFFFLLLPPPLPVSPLSKPFSTSPFFLRPRLFHQQNEICRRARRRRQHSRVFLSFSPFGCFIPSRLGSQIASFSPSPFFFSQNLHRLSGMPEFGRVESYSFPPPLSYLFPCSLLAGTAPLPLSPLFSLLGIFRRCAKDISVAELSFFPPSPSLRLLWRYRGSFPFFFFSIQYGICGLCAPNLPFLFPLPLNARYADLPPFLFFFPSSREELRSVDFQNRRPTASRVLLSFPSFGSVLDCQDAFTSDPFFFPFLCDPDTLNRTGYSSISFFSSPAIGFSLRFSPLFFLPCRLVYQ